MNLAKLKAYAPKARQDFLQAVTDRAAHYGIKQEGAEVVVLPVAEKGDGVVIGGRAFPRKVGEQRNALEKRIREHGFTQTMEALAYTWFNRLVAIRFMEAHGYLDHGFRVLSPSPHQPEGRGERLPEILEQAEHIALPGLNKQTVVDLKIDGTKDAQLYRLLLVAQCNALHSIMPFIFPMIDDETELVLPDNLLHSDSLVRNLAREITDEDCTSVEILGWLYQFYIAEKKDAVMARKSAVPTEDIPSVTQLFTPHWIVRYLVENSLGRLWLLNRPGSRLREEMPYYIEGEAEPDFLKIDKPEDIRVLDPAVGSGHMLTYAFDLLFAIYVEEGYAPAEVPALILRHNLHGLDICPRAAQLAALALVLKAREKSRRFFQPDKLVQPRIIAFQDIHLDEDELREYVKVLDLVEVVDEPMLKLLYQFEDAKTLGSLIQPLLDEGTIAHARSVVTARDLGGQLFLHAIQQKIIRVLEQAEALSRRSHVVVTNPPYMTGGVNPRLAALLNDRFDDTKYDLSATFVTRCRQLCRDRGFCALVVMHSWMFLSSLEQFRRELLSSCTVINLAHHGIGAFPTLNSKVVQTVAFVVQASPPPDGHAPICFRLLEHDPEVKERQLLRRENRFGRLKQQDFSRIQGSPVAYWISSQVAHAFGEFPPMSDIGETRIGLITGDNDRYLRFWHEVSLDHIGFGMSRDTARRSALRWFPQSKGGNFRRWYGNNETVVNWSNDGEELQTRLHESGKRTLAHNFNLDRIFFPAVTWTKVSSGTFSARLQPEGFLFNDASANLFVDDAGCRLRALAFLNSSPCPLFLGALNPTLNFLPGNVSALPFPHSLGADADSHISECASEAVDIARADWDSLETSWEFLHQPLLRPDLRGPTLEASWQNWKLHSASAVRRMQQLETENNRCFIDAFGMADELTPNVAIKDIALACNPDFRFKKPRKKRARDAGVDDASIEPDEDSLAYAEGDLEKLFLGRTIEELLSYVVGCVMGRYSIDRPGLILANAGDTLAQYRAKVGRPLDSLTFAPDEDGIIPVLDGEWFEDDVVARVREFLRATFGASTLEANLRFIEDALGKDLRKYFLADFFKDHRQTYKKRPIYWLFSSGKQRAFQCLVYLHRYNEGTLSRMRTEYVVPLQGRIASRVEQLEGDKAKATSTSHRKKLQKEQDLLKKQQTELLAFDEKLKHAAGQKISLNLDDGVKVNYGKFGDLLADVDAVTGGADE